jgi:hypothetical protein
MKNFLLEKILGLPWHDKLPQAHAAISELGGSNNSNLFP